MATGSYSCSSNPVGVTDERAVEKLLAKYDHHRQVTLNDGRLLVKSPSDTLKVDGPDGHEAEQQFLEDLAPYLTGELVITNHMNPPRQPAYTGRWVVSPDEGVSYEDNRPA